MLANPDPQRTAYHEAGHAVADYVLGREVKHVTINPDEEKGTLGHCAGAPPTEDEHPEYGLTHEAGGWVRDMLVSLQAGGLAEEKHCGECDEAGCGQDNEAAVSLAFSIAGSEEDAQAHLDTAHSQATVLIEKAWPAVEAVAAALLERKHLEGPEVIRIAEAALPPVSPRVALALEARLEALARQVTDLQARLVFAIHGAQLPFRFYRDMAPVAEVTAEGELRKVPPIQILTKGEEEQ